MSVTKLLSVSVAVAAFGALAGCSSGGATGAASTTTTGAVATTTTRGTGTSASNPPTGAAVNLLVTQDVRGELVQAGAALNGLTAADYDGLLPGMTYYTYDPMTATYWAGTALSPSPASTQAQVSSQDDGSYLLFERPANGAWTARPVGLTGTSDGPPCPVTVPSAILALWNWAPGTCRPMS